MTTWEQRVKDIKQAAQMTLAEIGGAIGMSTGGVGDIAAGRTKAPRGEAAVKLHALHERVCGKKHRKSS